MPKNDQFKTIEKKFYVQYLEYSNLDNLFFNDKIKIESNKSLEENKIKNNSIITIFSISFDDNFEAIFGKNIDNNNINKFISKITKILLI